MPRYSNFQGLQLHQMIYNLQSIPKDETMNNDETTSGKKRIAARLATANPLGLWTPISSSITKFKKYLLRHKYSCRVLYN